jgi:hypothetical protein
VLLSCTVSCTEHQVSCTGADSWNSLFQALEPGVPAIGTKCSDNWNREFQLSEQILKLLSKAVNATAYGDRDRATFSAG